MYKSTLALFDQYCQKFDALESSQSSRELRSEVRERLEQLSYIVSKVQELEVVATAVHRRFDAAMRIHLEDLSQRGISLEDDPEIPFPQMTREEVEGQKNALFELTLLTEAFYYFAGRVRTILRNTNVPLHGLGGFECEGVRNTRNKLLEHAEKPDSQVFTRSVGCGGTQGPVLKAIRLSTQTEIFPDRGLYVNAEEFKNNLERVVRTAL